MRNTFCLIIILFSSIFAAAASAHKAEGIDDALPPVVIVSSYNPDVSNISVNLQDFYDEYNKDKSIRNPLAIEDINAQNLPDSKNWETRMWNCLKKYYDNGKKPACIVLLGNEANTAYFSMDDKRLKKTPVIVGMRGSAIVKMPENIDEIDLRTWEPESYDLTQDFDDWNIVGGRLYQYDVQKNIDLILHFYPKCRRLLFLSDNTLGGVTMKALFEKEIAKDKRFLVEYIDGRSMSFLDVNEKISKENRPNTVLICGTWRIDDSNRYIVRNTTYTLGQNNPDLPVFGLADVGMGHWPVAGYSPRYHVMGRYLAKSVLRFLRTGEKNGITLAESKYIFDYEKLQTLHLSLNGIKFKYELENEPKSPLKDYLAEIVFSVIAFSVLALALAAALYFLRRSNKMRKQLEEQSISLREAKEAAEAANKMKSQFISNISHEIRTPLNAVIGFVQILTDENIELSTEEKEQYTGVIMTNGNLLLNLINDILDLSRIDSGRMDIHLQRVDVVKLINDAVHSARVNKSDAVDIIAKSPLPSKFIETDKNRLLQVISNLLNNAKKCTDKGSITVSLEDNPIDGMIRINVTDTGCGIPADKAEAVFERFRKLDTFRQGTGLGLSICQSIVEKFGGKIWVDTSYTSGARFSFTLPVKPEIKKEVEEAQSTETS